MYSDRGVLLVLVGHFGFAEDFTPTGRSLSYGGSGYACAVGARAGDPSRVGVVAHIGQDFDEQAIVRLGVDRRGARRVLGPAPHLRITQYTSTTRSFESSLGVATTPALDAFPKEYRFAEHVHLATMPVEEQAAWMHMIRSELGTCTVSVDMFESTAAEFPELCRELCYTADLVFMNKAEHTLLFTGHPMPTRRIVLKDGEHGATLMSPYETIHAPAPKSEVIDTTGAGELVAGAFLSLRAIGIADAIALRHAVAIASAKVSEFGLEGPNLKRAIDQVRVATAGEPSASSKRVVTEVRGGPSS